MKKKEPLFDRALRFVEAQGKEPMYLPGRLALLADENPDRHGKLTISLWHVDDANRLSHKIHEVTYWYSYQNKFLNLFNVTDILTIALKYTK